MPNVISRPVRDEVEFEDDVFADVNFDFLKESPFERSTLHQVRNGRMSIEEYEKGRDPEEERRLREQALYWGDLTVRWLEGQTRLYERYGQIMKRENFRRLDRGWDFKHDWRAAAQGCQLLMEENVVRSMRTVNGEKVYMKAKTLKNMERQMRDIVLEYEARDASTELKDRFREKLRKFRKALGSKYNLSSEADEKVAFYSEEVALIARCMLENAVHGATAVQNYLFLLLILHTGCRPSTLIPAKGSSFFIPFKDFVLIPRRNKHRKIVSFDLKITMRNFKGAMIDSSTSKRSKRVTMYLRGVNQPTDLVYDVGSAFLAHAIHVDMLPKGMATLEDVYNTPLDRIHFNEPKHDSPVFRRIVSRGNGLSNSPQAYESSREQLNRAVRKVGLQAGPGQIVGWSSIRRGTANRMILAFGHDNTRALFAHGAGTTALEEYYDETEDALDVVGAVLGGTLEQADATGLRLQPHQMIPVRYESRDMTLEEAMTIDLELRMLQTARAAVTECIMEGTDYWIEMRPFSDMPSEFSLDEPERALAKIKAASRARLLWIRRRVDKQIDEKSAEMRDQITFEEQLANTNSLRDCLDALPDRLIERVASNVRKSVQNAAPTAQDAEVDVDLDFITGEGEELAESVDLGTTSRVAASAGAKLDAYTRLAEKKRAWIDALVFLRGTYEDSTTEQLCVRCLSEPLVPEADKWTTRMAGQMKRHHGEYQKGRSGGYHSHERQFGRWARLVGEKFTCRICDQEYNGTSQALKRHMIKSHNDEAGKGIHPELWEYLMIGARTNKVLAVALEACPQDHTLARNNLPELEKRKRGQSSSLSKKRRRLVKDVLEDECLSVWRFEDVGQRSAMFMKNIQ